MKQYNLTPHAHLVEQLLYRDVAIDGGKLVFPPKSKNTLIYQGVKLINSLDEITRRRVIREGFKLFCTGYQEYLARNK